MSNVNKRVVKESKKTVKKLCSEPVLYSLVDDNAQEPTANPEPPILPSTNATNKINLGNNRFLTSGIYNGQKTIHIREYLSYGDVSYPTAKGIACTPTTFAALVHYMDEIDVQAESLVRRANVDYKQYLGQGIYVTVKTGYMNVSLRKFFTPAGTNVELPSKTGIALRINEWGELKKAVAEMFAADNELNVVPCFLTEYHSNQLASLQCVQCVPYLTRREYDNY
jgi:hypothetical protein